MRRKIRIEGVESVERHAWTGADITLRMRNDSRRDLRMDSCTVHVFRTDAGRTDRMYIGSLELRGGAGIDRRTESPVRLRMKMRMESPAAAQALWRRLADGETDGISILLEAKVRAGSRERRISTGILSLSSILNTFGVSDDEFSLYFQE